MTLLLYRGSRGTHVRNLQQKLIDLGFGRFMRKFGVDGHFGKETENALKKLQKWLGVKVDGIYGSQTEKAMNSRFNHLGLLGSYNFKAREFDCKDKYRTRAPNGMSKELIIKLERLRHELGDRPVTITSGYRTPAHNKLVGGASNSQHLYGRASDIKVKGVSPSKVYEVADRIFAKGGVGKYPTFVHVDTRGYRARF